MFFISLDLGQASDYSAGSLGQAIELGKRPSKVATTVGLDLANLWRWPLGTSYVDIVRKTVELVQLPELGKPTLILDATGVGRAVVDMFHEAGLSPIEITITGGDAVTVVPGGYRVPKRDIAGSLQAMFQQGTLQIADGLPLGPVFVKELENFKMKINVATGHDTYEALRSGDHDDLVLSAGMMTWYVARRHSVANFASWAKTQIVVDYSDGDEDDDN